MSDPDRKHLVKKDDTPPVTVEHPLNPQSEMSIRLLSAGTGMNRLGISEGRLTQGKEAFVYDSHATEEEFLYILEGRGLLRADDETMEVGAGDFIGFPTPSVAHLLSNPFREPLVYLMSGEHRAAEVAEFPDHGKRLFRTPDAAFIVDQQHVSPLRPKSSKD